MSAVRNVQTVQADTADTLEQIDVARNLMDKYHDVFQFVTTAAEARAAMKDGKVASFMGIEGAHQLGNSLGGRSFSLFCVNVSPAPVLCPRRALRYLVSHVQQRIRGFGWY